MLETNQNLPHAVLTPKFLFKKKKRVCLLLSCVLIQYQYWSSLILSLSLSILLLGYNQQYSDLTLDFELCGVWGTISHAWD